MKGARPPPQTPPDPCTLTHVWTDPASHRPVTPRNDPSPPPSSTPPTDPASGATGGADARPPAPDTDPGAGASDVGALHEELTALRATTAGLEDRLRRAQADFVNDLRRVQRQADDRVRFAAQAVVEDVLGVTDALHSAIEGLKDTEHERRVAEGLRMIDRMLLEALARHGVARIDALGKPFDPAVHEAVVERPVEPSVAEGAEGAARTVLAVLRPGFTLHGRLVRAAQVVVSKPGPRDEPAASAEAPATSPGPDA